MPNDIEMNSVDQEVTKNMETTFTHDDDVKQANGLSAHMDTASLQTPDETKAENRFVLKVDLMVLPLLVGSVFLASLVI